MDKPFWASKTIWANVIAVVAAGMTAFGLDIGPEMQATTVAFIMGVVNIALRFVTKDAVKV